MVPCLNDCKDHLQQPDTTKASVIRFRLVASFPEESLLAFACVVARSIAPVTSDSLPLRFAKDWLMLWTFGDCCE